MKNDEWWLIGCYVQYYLPVPVNQHKNAKSPFSMGKLAISMAVFNSNFDITKGYLPCFLGSLGVTYLCGIPFSSNQYNGTRGLYLDDLVAMSPE